MRVLHEQLLVSLVLVLLHSQVTLLPFRNPTFDSEDDSQRSYRYLKEDVREVKGQASMACIKDTTWRDNISKHTEAVVNGVKQPTSLINQPTSPGQEVSQEPVSPPALDSYICMVSQYSSLGGVGASLLQQQPGGQSTHRHTGYSEQNTPQMQLIYQPGSSRSVPGVINMSVVSQQDQHSPKLQVLLVTIRAIELIVWLKFIIIRINPRYIFSHRQLIPTSLPALCFLLEDTTVVGQ